MGVEKSSWVSQEAQRRAQEQLAHLQLPLQFMTELIEHQASVSFSKGEPIFLRSSTADVAYWVTSGLVNVYCPVSNGSAVLARVAGPGDLIGVIDTIGAGGRRVQALEARALTKTAVAIFTRDHMLTLLKTLNADSLVSLVENVNTAWSTAFTWWIGFLGLPFRERLQSTFRHLALRFGVRESRGILLTLELSHDDLAEMIASSRSTVALIF